MKILFINGSPRAEGNTAKLAAVLLKGHEYETVQLGTTKVYGYGQHFADDQFDEVLAKIKAADVVVMGSPVYWHNMSGILRNLLDHFYGAVENGGLKGRKLYFVYQGAAPEQWMIDAGKFTMNRFANLYGMEFGGMAVTRADAEALNRTL
ncbi:MAG: flavodoxin family protein [Pyramidobacter sp.]|jgi:multimeric flavodoxin WrbA